MWKRTKTHPLDIDLVLKLGRLEAEVESLQLKWKLHRDEMLKLVRRFEKREERQLAKERAEADETLKNVEIDVSEPYDAITARVLARRNRNAVPGQ